MADTFTGSASVFGNPQIQTAFDTAVQWFLNDQPAFMHIADSHPVSQAMPGAVVTISVLGQLPNATTPLNELLDVDAVAMPAPRQFNVTLNEYGNAVTTTERLQRTAFTGAVIKDISQTIAQNLGDSVDAIYQAVCDGASNKLYAGSAGAIQTTDPTTNLSNMTAKLATASPVKLRDRKAPPRMGANYAAYIHPDVSFDLRVEAGSAWTQAHTQVDTSNVYAGYVGTFQGADYIETPRCTSTAGTPRSYLTYYFGRQAVLDATVTKPGVRVGPITDKFSRFRPIGWYGFFGVTRFRENSIQLAQTTSSLASLFTTLDPKA